jgi:hypothetical protein
MMSANLWKRITSHRTGHGMVDWADAGSTDDAGRHAAGQEFLVKGLSTGCPTMDPDEIDKLLSQEISHLTMEEKQNIDDEIHGFYSRHPSPGGEPLVEHRRHLELFQNEIDKLDARDKRSYLWACSIQDGQAALTMMHPGWNVSTVHVLKDEYRLRFLRTTIYDVKKAAIRYCRWLDLLVDYFGEALLTRPIYLADLDEDSYHILKEGMIQLLPGRDRSGRRVIAFMKQLGEGRPLAMRAVVSKSLDMRGSQWRWIDLPLFVYCAQMQMLLPCIVLIGSISFSFDLHFSGSS